MNAWVAVKLVSFKLWIARMKFKRQDELIGEINQDYIDAMRGKRYVSREIRRLETELTKAKADLMTIRAIAPRRRFRLD